MYKRTLFNKSKTFALCYLLFALSLCACAKHDPILPGNRIPVFETGDVVVENKTIPDGLIIITNNEQRTTSNVNYEQDVSNVVWEVSADGVRRKIFSGLATVSRVDSTRSPAAAHGFVYAGLSTGEVVKINPKSRAPVWVADVYKQSALTGGASILDIVAPVQIIDNVVYAGGVGDAFCKIKENSGSIIWCVNIGTATPFIIAGGAAFVVATNNRLYAIDLKDGGIFWQTEIKKQFAPQISETTDGNFIIKVGKETFSATSGMLVK
ncbi:MAG: PQQ-like beta-propeller repeat protein [Rickettsiales bacterium]|nr:PQQ-like beta-propeller repeat protein [Rickettsiales bacterium]